MTKDLISVRLSEEDDRALLINCLQQPGVLRWFPLTDRNEIEDAARVWLANMKYEAAITALYDGRPCGLCTLYPQPFVKLAHQSLFAIIVDEQYRGRGVGTYLLQEIEKRAKEKFRMTLLHLEVYEGNPAIHLYQRAGFMQYGYQRHFVKDEGQYLAKIMMQKNI